MLDCLIVGAGPAGLTGALYLARFGRRYAIVDAGQSRAGWIPMSHNIPTFPAGISGDAILDRQRDHLARHGHGVVGGTVASLAREGDGFVAEVAGAGDAPHRLRARRVLLATGAADAEPDLPDLPDAIRRGLVRYCPICDGFEVRDRRIAVFGDGRHGLAEAIFLARTYSGDVTLLLPGETDLDEDEARRAEAEGLQVVRGPVVDLTLIEGRIAALRTTDGVQHRFDTLYSALGLRPRSDLARSLGANCDGTGAIVIDAHQRTSVPGLYAAGGTVRGLDQVVVAQGHAAVAATAIHNRCELPLAEESAG